MRKKESITPFKLTMNGRKYRNVNQIITTELFRSFRAHARGITVLNPQSCISYCRWVIKHGSTVAEVRHCANAKLQNTEWQ